MRHLALILFAPMLLACDDEQADLRRAWAQCELEPAVREHHGPPGGYSLVLGPFGVCMQAHGYVFDERLQSRRCFLVTSEESDQDQRCWRPDNAAAETVMDIRDWFDEHFNPPPPKSN